MADIPDSYQPIVIKPPFSLSERLVDLTPILEKAKADRRPILLYMGAQDCPPCREYERFLAQHQAELLAAYAPWTVVEVRTWLKGPKLVFLAGGQRYSVVEFKAAVGDQNKIFSWPYWWLISADMRQIKQLPQGSQHFLDVDRHKMWLQIGKPPAGH